MLPLFPEHVLDNSLHTAILLGLVVTWAMYEWFGWVFAGFVVAGYLSALAIVAPPSLFVVMVEAILTYGIVWGLATGMSLAGVWSRVFGRERFLLFVLVAIPVRLLVTGLAMPRLAAHLVTAGLDPEGLGLGLFGVGVVLVPLVANTFWKLGPGRGLAQLSVSTGLTWLLVSQVLVRFTNFGFGDFEHTFDALAVSAWESSRTVLVLVCTVFLGARNNLRYGWDFGGILVPALLAMLAFTPAKLLSTVAEMVILYVVYENLIKLPPIAARDLEGPRRIVSIYAVSYAWKWMVALVVGALLPSLHVADVFGFGYLLTSLVVARAHKARSLPRTLMPLLTTSAQGLALALVLSVGLAWLPLGSARPLSVPDAPAPASLAAPRLALEARPEPLRPGDALAAAVAVTPRDDTAARGAGCVPEPGPLAHARPEDPLRLDCAGQGPVLVVPRPRGDRDAAWMAGWIADRIDAAGVVIASVDPSTHPTRSVLADEVVVATVHAARAWAPGHPVLVVSTRPGPPRLHLRDPGTVTSLGPVLALGDVRLDTGAPPEHLAAVWAALGPQDGLLGVPLDLVDDAPAVPDVALAAAPTVAPEQAPHDPDLLLDTVLPGAIAAARTSEADAPLPAWLVHTASLVGATVAQAEDPDGHVHWVLVRASDADGAVDRWILRPGGSPWTVLASDGWRWPGLGPIALHHHLALDATATWLGQHPPSTDVRWADADDPERSRLDRMVRALLAPPPGWRQDGAAHPPGRVLVVEVAPEESDAIVLTAGNEVADADLDPGVAGAVDATFATWPGRRLLKPEGLEPTWQPSLAYAGTYQEAIAAEGMVVAWYPPRLVREPAGTADHDALVLWYLAAGVPVRTVPDPDRVLLADVRGDPVAVPALHGALATLADRPSDAALLKAIDVARQGVEVWQTPERLVLVGRDGGVVCTAVAAAADAFAPPWSGCWRMP
ncbi:MAG: poly-gamma-glutamate biosynthesis protein PgsC/CapC [Alphaproteobacteria bacterium]|nr:poly-gamma-glutamate biosynthesis protein PgsC/CapC [Alphaproteobacteria bacterium]